LAIQHAVHPPELWINAASATIYPHATNESRDESFTYFNNEFYECWFANFGKALSTHKEQLLQKNVLCAWWLL